jgi:hypothetical protein
MAEALDLAAAARDHAALLAQIAAANLDLATRIQMLGVSVVYDDDIDILFCQFGPPTEALTETVNDWLAVRVDPETLKVLGFELMSLRLPGSGDEPGLLPLILHAASAASSGNLAAEVTEAQTRLAGDLHTLLAA